MNGENDRDEFRGPVVQRHVGGRRRDTHTADKVLTHGHTLLFYICIVSIYLPNLPVNRADQTVILFGYSNLVSRVLSIHIKQ